MYKLICGNLTKSHRSLTNFTRYYRIVAEKYGRSSSTGKYVSDMDVHKKLDVEDNVEDNTEGEQPGDMESNTNIPTFFSNTIIHKPLCQRQSSSAVASTSRFFHTTDLKEKNSNKTFKSREAEEYYQTALEQCMTIKQKLDKYYRQASGSVRPPRLISDLKKELETIQAMRNQLKPKHAQKVFTPPAPEVEKSTVIKTIRSNYQFKPSKIRIKYPTHTVRYKLGTYKLQHSVQQHKLSNVVEKQKESDPLQAIKIKHEKASERDKAKLKQIKSKAQHKRLPILANFLQHQGEATSEQAKQQQKLEEAFINQHPTVQPTTTTVTMAYKSRYNQLLRKSGLLYQAPKKQDDAVITKDADKKDESESKQNAYEIIFKRPDNFQELDKPSEPRLVQHPIAVSEQEKIDETPPKHTKAVLADKPEIIDIEATCIKSNSSDATSKNIGKYTVETEEKVKSFVEAHKQEMKNREGTVNGKLKTKEETVVLTDSIGEYLKKLRALRDQTAVNNKVDKQPEPTQKQSVEKQPSNAETQEKQPVPIPVDLKEIKTKQYPILDNKSSDLLVSKADKVLRRVTPKEPPKPKSATNVRPSRSLARRPSPPPPVKETPTPQTPREQVQEFEDIPAKRNLDALKRIMEQYQVSDKKQTQETPSTAQLKRMSRKKRREEEKRFREELREKQKQMEGRERREVEEQARCVREDLEWKRKMEAMRNATAELEARKYLDTATKLAADSKKVTEDAGKVTEPEASAKKATKPEGNLKEMPTPEPVLEEVEKFEGDLGTATKREIQYPETVPEPQGRLEKVKNFESRLEMSQPVIIPEKVPEATLQKAKSLEPYLEKAAQPVINLEKVAEPEVPSEKIKSFEKKVHEADSVKPTNLEQPIVNAKVKQFKPKKSNLLTAWKVQIAEKPKEAQVGKVADAPAPKDADTVTQKLETKPYVKMLSRNSLSQNQLENLKKLREASTKIVKLCETIVTKTSYEATEPLAEFQTPSSAHPENQPTIRREKPEPNPKEKQKKEQRKSKTDIVLPPKEPKDPKMQYTGAENDCLRESRQNMLGEINKVLYKLTFPKYKLAGDEQDNKCKSLADLAEEQKAKMLKEIEDKWNDENKTKKKEAKKEDPGMSILDIDKRRYDKDYGMKDARLKLIIKLKYPGVSAQASTSKRPATVPKAPSPTSSQTQNLQLSLECRQPTMVASTQDCQYSTGLCFASKKRARIEDDSLLSKLVTSPKSTPIFKQNDLDASFLKLRKAKIEEEVTPRATRMFQQNDLDATFGKLNNKAKIEQDAFVKPQTSTQEESKHESQGDIQKLSVEILSKLNSATSRFKRSMEQTHEKFRNKINAKVTHSVAEDANFRSGTSKRGSIEDDARKGSTKDVKLEDLWVKGDPPSKIMEKISTHQQISTQQEKSSTQQEKISTQISTHKEKILTHQEKISTLKQKKPMAPGKKTDTRVEGNKIAKVSNATPIQKRKQEPKISAAPTEKKNQTQKPASQPKKAPAPKKEDKVIDKSAAQPPPKPKRIQNLEIAIKKADQELDEVLKTYHIVKKSERRNKRMFKKGKEVPNLYKSERDSKTFVVLESMVPYPRRDAMVQKKKQKVITAQKKMSPPGSAKKHSKKDSNNKSLLACKELGNQPKRGNKQARDKSNKDKASSKNLLCPEPKPKAVAKTNNKYLLCKEPEPVANNVKEAHLLRPEPKPKTTKASSKYLLCLQKPKDGTKSEDAGAKATKASSKYLLCPQTPKTVTKDGDEAGTKDKKPAKHLLKPATTKLSLQLTGKDESGNKIVVTNAAVLEEPKEEGAAVDNMPGKKPTTTIPLFRVSILKGIPHPYVSAPSLSTQEAKLKKVRFCETATDLMASRKLQLKDETTNTEEWDDAKLVGCKSKALFTISGSSLIDALRNADKAKEQVPNTGLVKETRMRESVPSQHGKRKNLSKPRYRLEDKQWRTTVVEAVKDLPVRKRSQSVPRFQLTDGTRKTITRTKHMLEKQLEMLDKADALKPSRSRYLLENQVREMKTVRPRVTKSLEEVNRQMPKQEKLKAKTCPQLGVVVQTILPKDVCAVTEEITKKIVDGVNLCKKLEQRGVSKDVDTVMKLKETTNKSKQGGARQPDQNQTEDAARGEKTQSSNVPQPVDVTKESDEMKRKALRVVKALARMKDPLMQKNQGDATLQQSVARKFNKLNYQFERLSSVTKSLSRADLRAQTYPTALNKFVVRNSSPPPAEDLDDLKRKLSDVVNQKLLELNSNMKKVSSSLLETIKTDLKSQRLADHLDSYAETGDESKQLQQKLSQVIEQKLCVLNKNFEKMSHLVEKLRSQEVKASTPSTSHCEDLEQLKEKTIRIINEKLDEIGRNFDNVTTLVKQFGEKGAATPKVKNLHVKPKVQSYAVLEKTRQAQKLNTKPVKVENDSLKRHDEPKCKVCNKRTRSYAQLATLGKKNALNNNLKSSTEPNLNTRKNDEKNNGNEESNKTMMQNTREKVQNLVNMNSPSGTTPNRCDAESKNAASKKKNCNTAGKKVPNESKANEKLKNIFATYRSSNQYIRKTCPSTDNYNTPTDKQDLPEPSPRNSVLKAIPLQLLPVDTAKPQMTAKIEEVFKKYYKEEEKIYKFNKHLIRHFQNKALTDPKCPDDEDKRKLLYTLIVTELRKSCQRKLALAAKQSKLVQPQPKIFYIEKSLPNPYIEKCIELPPKPVTRPCDKLCLPLQDPERVALTQPVEDATTLTCRKEKYCVVPKAVADKYKDRSMKVQTRSKREGLVPAMLILKAKNATTTDTEEKRKLLEFRYEMLRKLHEEFTALGSEDFKGNVGKFQQVSKYYQSVKEKFKNVKSGETRAVTRVESMEKLLGPCTKPSFDRVCQYYNLVMGKDKKETSRTEVLLEELSKTDKKPEAKNMVEKDDTTDGDKPPKTEK